MLRAIQEFFEQNMQLSGGSREADRSSEHALQLATAALLIETSRADFDEKAEERRVINDNLLRFFNLTPEETRTLVALAEEEANDSTSLHQFTSLIHQHYTNAQKRQIVEMMWRVSYADGHKDMHEEHLVRKVANLLYVPHKDFIQTRHRVEEELARPRDKDSGRN